MYFSYALIILLHTHTSGLILRQANEVPMSDAACAFEAEASEDSRSPIAKAFRGMRDKILSVAQWEFAISRTSEAFESRHQCGPEPTLDAAFASLDAKIGGSINREDVIKASRNESIGLRFVVRDGVLSHYVSRGRKEAMVRARLPAYVSLLNDLLSEVELPDMEFAVSLLDRSPGSAHVFKTEGDPGKDLLFIPRSLSDWGRAARSLAEKYAREPCTRQHPQAVFRGATTGGRHVWNASASDRPLRAFDGSQLPRFDVVALSNERPDLLDAGFTEVVQSNEPKFLKQSLHAQGMMRGFLSDDEQRCFAAAVVVDGNSMPDRFPRQLAYGVPVVLVHRQSDEFWYKELRPGVHYLPATPGTLVEVLEKLRGKPELARCIGANGRRFLIDHLNENRLKCYLHRLLTEYSKRYKES